MTTLLDEFKEQQTYLTSFLREKPEYAKAAWMNEIISENNFDEAAKTLLDLGLKREQDVWSKKVELSIGKLSRLASRNRSQQNGRLISDEARIELATAQDQLELIKIQDTVYGWTVPSISEAIDENAELDLALGEHSFNGLKDQPTFISFLHDQMANLINHKAMDALSLIDLLTLMDDNATAGEESYRYQQFYLALQATRYGISDKSERTLVQRVIWRRCMLRDNWSEVNDTDGKDDKQVSERLSYTALYQTFRACLKNGKSSVCRLYVS
jgi:nuclear pore complex protein Nup133